MLKLKSTKLEGGRWESLIDLPNKPIVMGLLIFFSILLGVATVKGGLVTGLLLCVALLGLPIVYAIVAFPIFGIIFLLGFAFFLFFIFRMGVNFPLGTALDGMQAILILGFFIGQKSRPDWSIFKGPVSTILLIWISYNVIQVVNPYSESRLAWVYTVRTIAVITLMYYVFLYHIRTIAQLRLIIKVWLAFTLIASIYSYKQEYIGFSDSEMAYLRSDPLTTALLFINGHWRKYSIFSDPVEFAYNMVLGSVLCLTLLFGPFANWKKYILGISFLLITNSTLFSGTRGAYVLLPACLILLVVLKFNKQVMLFFIVAAVFFTGLIFMPTGNASIARFQSAFRPSDDASYNVRKINQEKMRPYIRSHPIGGGLGATGVWGVRFAPYSYLAQFPPDSGYVRVAAEMGWIGLFLICTLLFIFLKTGINYFYKIKDPELKTYCLTMVMVIFALNIGNFPQEALVQYPNNLLFYLAIAIIQICYRLDQNLKLENKV